MIEVFNHPLEGIGTIPIATAFHQVETIVDEISHVNILHPVLANLEIAAIYWQIRAMSLDLGHIQGETNETITHNHDGSVTISETGIGEAMSLSIGFSPATANATAYSSNPNVAFAGAATAAASFNRYADAIAVAIGNNVTAITTVA